MTAYADFYRQSIDHRDAFWSEQALVQAVWRISAVATNEGRVCVSLPQARYE